MLRQATGNPGLTRLTMAQTRGKPPPSPIQYSMRLSTTPTSEWLFVPGLPRRSPETVPIWTLESLRVHNFLFRPSIGMRSKANLQFPLGAFQQCVALQLHTLGLVDSRLLVVGSQIVNLTLGLSFCHNSCYRCPNGSCEAIFDIYTSIAFECYKERLKARCFDPCNRTLKFQESQRSPKSPFQECECHPHILPKSGVATLCH